MRETLAAGAVAKFVAERHGISTGLLFTWRKQMLAAAMRGVVPVAETGPDQTPVLTGPELPAREGAVRPTAAEAMIEVELQSGARVRIGAGADAGLVRDVLAALALDAGVRSGQIQPGQRLLLEGVGGGFTWGAVLAQF